MVVVLPGGFLSCVRVCVCMCVFVFACGVIVWLCVGGCVDGETGCEREALLPLLSLLSVISASAHWEDVHVGLFRAFLVEPCR